MILRVTPAECENSQASGSQFMLSLINTSLYKVYKTIFAIYRKTTAISEI